MFDFNKDAGESNLSFRAYLAAVVGPQRVVHGSRAIKQLPTGRPILVARNGARSPSAMYVEVSFGQELDNFTAPRLAFSSSEGAGNSSEHVAFVSIFEQRYGAVLLPGEELFVRAVDVITGVLPDPIPVIVATVSF